MWGTVKLFSLKKGIPTRKGPDCDLSYDSVQTFGCDWPHHPLPYFVLEAWGRMFLREDVTHPYEHAMNRRGVNAGGRKIHFAQAPHSWWLLPVSQT
jgi:hypothetical protein